MGDWTYYVTLMKLRDAAERISIAGDIHKTRTLKELIQRELVDSSHSARIADYLLNQSQRLFSPLTVGVYGGDPQWYELDIRQSVLHEGEELPSNVRFILGLLHLSGSEELFAIDGQHRLVGIKEALKSSTSLGDEEVGILFVSHRNTPEGMSRSRRLFTTLNKYAKPVSPFDRVALDEDDLVALVTRRLLEEHPLFMDKLSLTRSTNLPPVDRRNFTSLIALYNAMDQFLRDRRRGWSDFKRYRPSDEVIEEAYNRATHLWNEFVNVFPPVKEMFLAKPEDDVASKYRGSAGGHLLFRPIGLAGAVHVVRLLMDSSLALDEAVQRVAKVPMQLNEPPWLGVVWNPVANAMIVNDQTQRIVPRLLLFGAGGNLKALRTTEQVLKEQLAGLLNLAPHEVQLQRFVDPVAGGQADQ
jgi:DNA sulfur modification protein DndB